MQNIQNKGGVFMLIIGNGRTITRDTSNPFLENGAVAMDGIRLFWWGRRRT